MLKTSTEEVIKLFNELDEETKNFQEFDLELFIDDPKKILILRLILGMKLKEFAKFVDTSFQIISRWENRHVKPSKWKMKSVLDMSIRSIKTKQNISITDVVDTFNKFKRIAQGSFKIPGLSKRINNNLSWIKRQCRALKGNKACKRTQDEIEIAKILTKNRIPFIEQFPIIPPGKTKAGMAIVDFFVKLGSSEFVIEVSKSNGSKAKERALILAHKGFRMRKYFPNIHFISFIITKEPNDKIVAMLSESFDEVVINDFNQVINIVKNSAGIGI